MADDDFARQIAVLPADIEIALVGRQRILPIAFFGRSRGPAHHLQVPALPEVAHLERLRQIEVADGFLRHQRNRVVEHLDGVVETAARGLRDAEIVEDVGILRPPAPCFTKDIDGLLPFVQLDVVVRQIEIHRLEPGLALSNALPCDFRVLELTEPVAGLPEDVLNP
jgi:hypothetical protein